MKNLRTDKKKMLLIGIGNSGRGDDGLGWKFTDLVAQAGYPFFDYEYRYQLQIEDTVLIKNYDIVIFADASHAVLKDGFEVQSCRAANHYLFSSHMQSPETLLYLAKDLYNKSPKAYTIAIPGHYWEMKTSLSNEANKNLRSAYTFFMNEFLPTIIRQVNYNNIERPA